MSFAVTFNSVYSSKRISEEAAKPASFSFYNLYIVYFQDPFSDFEQ